MAYPLIIASTLLFSFQFFFQKRYNESYGTSVSSSLIFAIFTAVAGSVVLGIMNLVNNGYILQYSTFSLLVAAVYCIVNTLFIVVSAKSFETADLAVFSMFAMLGGMIIPFVFGVCYKDEDFNIKKISGLIVITIVLIVSSVEFRKTDKSKKISPKTLFYYLAVFTLNGVFGVILTIHQMEKYKAVAVDSYSLMILSKLISIPLCLIILLIMRSRFIKPTFSVISLSTLHATFNSLGNLFLLIALLSIPTSVQYPIVTGGTIIISSIISFVEKKKIDIKQLICAFVALGATILFVI